MIQRFFLYGVNRYRYRPAIVKRVKKAVSILPGKADAMLALRYCTVVGTEKTLNLPVGKRFEIFCFFHKNSLFRYISFGVPGSAFPVPGLKFLEPINLFF